MGLTFGFGDIADDPVGLVLDIAVVLAVTGLVLRFGDEVGFSFNTFLFSISLGSFTSSVGCGAVQGTLTSSTVTFSGT